MAYNKSLEGKTPFGAWHDTKPYVSNLKFCGYLCFTHIPDAKREKLDEKAEYGVFMGYSTITKGYRIFQPLTGKFIISRDVTFDEDAEWNWEKSEPIRQTTEREEAIELDEDNYNELLVRGTRSLAEIYQKYNVVVLEPAGYEETANDPNAGGDKDDS